MGPTVVRRQLGRLLRQLRDGSGLTVDEVTSDRYLGISRAKLFRLEAGRHSVRPQDVTVLCARYGITSRTEVEALQALAVASQERSWWHIYGEDAVPEWFSLYIDLEPTASLIRTYEAEAVPGLLQTRDYAWAIHRAYHPDADDEEIERRIAVRMDRQKMFDRAKPRHLHAVINEAALLRQVGGAEVMDTQLVRLRAAAERPEITIDVLPLSAGAHAAMEGAFAILDFPDPDEDPSVAYIETASSAAYLQKPAEIARYDAIFTKILPSTIPLQEYSP
uniref:helix-turn-helix domain-containing protein n=1 Tax=Pseudonocardia sp. CA-138482 TaxID=3240023 RepID=UPI003F493A89